LNHDRYIHSEGIILQTLPIKDWDLLITAFTKENGVVKYYYKNGQSRKRSKGALTSPLTRAEFVCRKWGADLVPLSEISVIDVQIDLRKTLELLETSCSWLKLIQQSQLPGKPAKELYLLLITFLNTLPAYSNPSALDACFHMKLLRHEGLIELDTSCSVCGRPSAFQKGEAFCPSHMQAGSVPFNLTEFETLKTLAFCRSLKEIEPIIVDGSLLEKVMRLYKEVSTHFSA